MCFSMEQRRGTAIMFFSQASCCWMQEAGFASKRRRIPSISFTAGRCARAGTSSSLIFSADSGELPQVLADIHIPNQAVQIIRMEVEQFGRLGKIAAGLLDGFDNQLPLQAFQL